jgi:parvulin-like peptidyl-prolyl isomerase
LPKLQRLALLGFGGLVVLLFLGFAVAQGLGDPSIPSGAVAIVEDAPDDIDTVTEDEFQRAIARAAAGAQIKPIPKPGAEEYEGLKETALGELLDTIWIQGEAAEMGISVTPEEVAAELKTLKGQSFETEQQYQEYLEEGHFTQADVDRQVKVRMLGTKIQAQIDEEAPAPSDSEIEDYYEAAKSSEFTTPESRDARIIVNRDKGKVEEAKAALEKDNSNQSWKEVAKRYSTNQASGGLAKGFTDIDTEEPEPLNEAIFAASTGQIDGPLDTPDGYTVFEVVKVTSEEVESFEEAEPGISSKLSDRFAQEDFADFLRTYNIKWESRTFCAPEATIQRCANFKGTVRPEAALPACYEADPEEPAEECPAPVTQVKPALPGSVSPLLPEGTQKIQRPRPPGDDESAPPPAPTEIPGAPPPVE